MRLRTLPIFLCATVALAACGGQAATNTTAILPLANKPVTTQSASVVRSNQVVPISVAAFVPCANGGSGEVVVLSGNLHMSASTTITANNIHATFADNPQGVSGVGSVTGDKYQGTGVTREDENIANAGFPAVFTYVDNFRIIGQGAGNNLLVHGTTHATINANGTFTAYRSGLSIACR